MADLLACVPDDWVDDAASLGAAFARRYPSWQGTDAKINPSFAGSEHVGGADPDLIVDGCVWEIRTTKRRKGRSVRMYQLLGPFLLDDDDVGMMLSLASGRVPGGDESEHKVSSPLLGDWMDGPAELLPEATEWDEIARFIHVNEQSGPQDLRD